MKNISLLILTAIVGIALFFAPRASAADDACKAIALQPVHAVEDPAAVILPGQYLTAITQYIVNSKTGLKSFCSHGGDCFPEFIKKNGKAVQALSLENCKIGNPFPNEPWDDGYTTYAVVLIRPLNSSKTLRRFDLEKVLLKMGLCEACADNVAHFYIEQPSSRCARLTQKALEGNPDAKAVLQNWPPYCQITSTGQ